MTTSHTARPRRLPRATGMADFAAPRAVGSETLSTIIASRRRVAIRAMKTATATPMPSSIRVLSPVPRERDGEGYEDDRQDRQQVDQAIQEPDAGLQRAQLVSRHQRDRPEARGQRHAQASLSSFCRITAGS